MTKQQTVLAFNYTDRWSTFLLWWKAIFLAPIWAFPALAFLGSFVVFFGPAAMNFTFVVLIVSFLAYFIDDMLKRRIRIESNILTHGFRAKDLSKLLSIGTDYKGTEVLPKKMVLTFADGNNMTFKLSRINAADYQTFLRFVETNYPQCRIDPVLTTLISCKRIARKVLVDDTKQLIIEYKTEQLWRVMWRSFLETATPWLRIGPVFASFLFAPFWLKAVQQWMLVASSWKDRDKLMEMSDALSKIAWTMTEQIGKEANSAGTVLMDVLAHPIIACISTLALIWLLATMIQKLFKPNSLVVDQTGLSMVCATPATKIIVERIVWEDVANIGIEKKADGTTKIKFNLLSKRRPVFYLDLASIAEENRLRLSRALARFAPGSTIDSDLNEAMMPKQERSYTELWLQSLSTPPERSSLQALTPGRRLHNYQFAVLRRLAVGGQGTAYLCQDEVNNKTVVLKETIVPVYADRIVKEQALKRFEQEATMLKSLDCDQIVALEDYFFEDHRGYLVLEHVDGLNLRQLIEDQGPLSEERARELAAQMCTILQYLHEKKIVHRDFTPDNVLLNSEGRLKLIDFNVAQFEKVGTTGTIAGKHAYLPPEQFRGKATTQSDIYAMGATLHYLVTGKDPEPISQSSPLEAGAKVSEEFDSLIRDCTALDCVKRCASVETVNHRLSNSAIDPLDQAIEIEMAKSEKVSLEEPIKEYLEA